MEKGKKSGKTSVQFQVESYSSRNGSEPSIVVDGERCGLQSRQVTITLPINDVIELVKKMQSTIRGDELHITGKNTDFQNFERNVLYPLQARYPNNAGLQQHYNWLYNFINAESTETDVDSVCIRYYNFSCNNYDSAKATPIQSQILGFATFRINHPHITYEIKNSDKWEDQFPQEKRAPTFDRVEKCCPLERLTEALLSSTDVVAH